MREADITRPDVEDKPYSVSFATRTMRSRSSSSMGIAQTTGPKISSCTTRMSRFVSAKHRGLHEVALAAHGLAADHDLGSLLRAGLHVPGHAIELLAARSADPSAYRAAYPDPTFNILRALDHAADHLVEHLLVNVQA